MYEQLKQIITAAIEQQSVLLEEPIDISNGQSSPLYGNSGQIDSLTLVSILVDVETAIRSQLGVEVRLADTSGLPSSATPFATLGSLSTYVQSRCAAMLVGH